MGNTKEETANLLSRHPEIEDELEIVATKAESNDTIQWADLSETVDSDSWGTIIQSNIVVEKQDGFEVSDPSIVLEEIHQRSDESVLLGGPDMNGGWSGKEKLAVLVSLNMLFVYYATPFKEPFMQGLNSLLSPLDAFLPFWSVVAVLGVAGGIFSTLVRRRVIDGGKKEKFKERVTELRDWDGDKGSMSASAAHSEQMAALNAQKNLMSLQFRPLAYVLNFTVPVLLWLRWYTNQGLVAEGQEHITVPIVGEIGLTGDLLWSIPEFIVVYAVGSAAVSVVLKRVFGLTPTPNENSEEQN